MQLQVFVECIPHCAPILRPYCCELRNTGKYPSSGVDLRPHSSAFACRSAKLPWGLDGQLRFSLSAEGLCICTTVVVSLHPSPSSIFKRNSFSKKLRQPRLPWCYRLVLLSCRTLLASNTATGGCRGRPPSLAMLPEYYSANEYRTRLHYQMVSGL